MKALYVGSSEPYSGKTLASVVLAMRWRDRGLRVGYLKPIGVPSARSPLADEDALFIASQLGLPAAPAQLCPALLNPDLCGQDPATVRARLREAFDAASADKDVLLMGGADSVFSSGAVVGLTGAAVAELLDAQVLLMAKYTTFVDLDPILASYRLVRDRCLGVLVNRVPAAERPTLEETVLPCLASEGARVLGVLPDDPLLHSVSVKELAEAMEARFLTGAESAEELVEHFVVGAMSVESALHYFRRMPRKCVITGGDRGDIQLAALETPTRCLILTGDLAPTPTVLSRAQELKVPVLLVKPDTLTTVTAIEGLLGTLRLREPKKAEHALKQFEKHVALEELDRALGLG